MTFDEACEVLNFDPPMERVTDAAKESLVRAVDEAIADFGLEGAKELAGNIKFAFTQAFLVPGRIIRDEPKGD